MPEGDVTPHGNIRAGPAERLSKHWPYMTVSASLPWDPVRPPASAHMDTQEFPDLEHSLNVGIGGLVDFKDAPQATTQGKTAFQKPTDGQGTPRLKEGHPHLSPPVRPCHRRARPPMLVPPAP